ncbi:MAG: DUF4124 domain-containing protein [Gammaproteobacteria bacterium]|jgi:hypothetical protein
MKTLMNLLLLTSVFSVHAGVYKWVDENGKVHYGDRPEAAQPAVEMDVDDTAVTVPAFGGDDLSRDEKRERLLEAMEEDRIEKQEKLEKQKAIREQNRRKCNGYRDRMRHYERASALYKLDDNGNRVYMSETDRARATKDLRAKISKYCR